MDMAGTRIDSRRRRPLPSNPSLHRWHRLVRAGAAAAGRVLRTPASMSTPLTLHLLLLLLLLLLQ